MGLFDAQLVLRVGYVFKGREGKRGVSESGWLTYFFFFFFFFFEPIHQIIHRLHTFEAGNF